MTPRNILLVGEPGSGKTTVLQKTMALLPRRKFGGFFIRNLEGGRQPTRKAATLPGYRERRERHLVLIRGKTRQLAERPLERHIAAARETWVLDPTSLLEEGLRSVVQAQEEAEVVVLDALEEAVFLERAFQERIQEVFACPAVVLAATREISSEWIQNLAQLPETVVLEVRQENRATLQQRLADQLSTMLTA
jgi:nucleoside-triphosphatase THEP1